MQKILFRGETGSLHIEQVRRNAERGMPVKHFHSNYELYYLLSGSIHYFIDNTIYRVSKGSLVLVDSNQIHKTSSAGVQHERILLEIGTEVLRTLDSLYPTVDVKSIFADSAHVLPLNGEGQNFVENLLLNMVDETKRKQTGYEVCLQLKLMELLIFIKRERASSSPTERPADIKHQKMAEIAGYISEHYNENLTLDGISSLFYVSKYYLCRVFKQNTGFTVNEYMNVNRIKKAKELLQNGKYSITQVSQAVGYDSVTHFDRVFKSYMGVSPMAYRRLQSSKK